MADIRIKDITTTASASLTGDFLPIDGSTGTRKLNAFSPTFGGNATVTGTLTTNGYTFTSGTLSSFSSTAGIYNYYSSGVGVLASYSDGSGTRSQTQISGSIVSLNTAAGNALTVSAAGVVSIPATTASTTTSSGALVVGNGTSGGLGVGGAIYCGGDIISSGNGNIQGGRFTSVNSNSYIEQSGTDFTYVTGGSRPHVFSIGGTTRLQVTTSGIISSLPASAASLSTNSTMTFELTSNTSLKIAVRGTDGTTRSVSLTLA